MVDVEVLRPIPVEVRGVRETATHWESHTVERPFRPVLVYLSKPIAEPVCVDGRINRPAKERGAQRVGVDSQAGEWFQQGSLSLLPSATDSAIEQHSVIGPE